MHDDDALLRRRIERELHDRVLPAMYAELVPLDVVAWEVPGEPVDLATAREGLARDGRPLHHGDHYGRPWGTTWMSARGEVPADWPAAAVEAVFDLGFHPDAAGFQSEGLVWTTEGPVQGIHPRRTAYPLPSAGPGPIEVLVEVASNPAFPLRLVSPADNLGALGTAGDRPLYRLRQAALGRRDHEVYHLLLDVEVLLGLVTAADPAARRTRRVVRHLVDAFDRLDVSSPAAVRRTAAAARAALRPALDATGPAGAHHVVAVGHAHIDTAWLWPLRETVRKCARTFASAVRMIDDHPSFHFVCSQAVQYHWMETQYPELFARIARRIADGRWHPVGGMWVEADMNLPSGESLCRQLVHGQRYFESRFGHRCREVWIPDVFGYPASLPQIFRAGGCDRFVTQKLSWNQQNRFPHSTFWWKGLDGSRVLTHFPPVETYNATVTPSELLHAERTFHEHAWSSWSLMPFGHGNGGGGPTREMIERAARVIDLEGLPRVRLGTTDEFFAHVEAEVAGGAAVPVWDGELYFEMHRGTLTSQVRTKQGNRRNERLLREAELWWATARGTLPEDVVAALDECWKEVLVQQFHDILPGSSITWVHDDAVAVHGRVTERLESLVSAALAESVPDPTRAWVANPTAADRTEVVVVPGHHHATDHEVDAAPGCQVLHDGTVAVVVSVPAFGLSPLHSSPTPPLHPVTVTERSFANGLLAVSWNLDGAIVSIIDLAAGREVLPPGSRIGLELAADHPVEYDAWDLEAWSAGLGQRLEECGVVHAVDVVDAGPLSARLRVVYRVAASEVVCTFGLRAGSAQLDVDIDVDWQEDERLLSLMVPIDVRAREAACGVQFGHVMRPTHASTSWDAAKFEVCAHRWVDLAEANWGVAVLDDGRYGHGLHEQGIRVSLLRAARYPDPEQDRGRHVMRLAVRPHGAGRADVVRAAAVHDAPLRLVPGGGRRPDAGVAPASTVGARPVVQVAGTGLEVSAVKRADDGSGELVVRLAEVCGDRAAVSVIVPGRRIVAASRCTLFEEPTHSLDVADGLVALDLRPFELVTLRCATE